MNRQSILIFIMLLTGSISCRVNRPAIVPSAGVNSASEYIQRYKDLAVNEMKRSGVPASITLAQGMVESDYGRSALARVANNHFGIKCHESWKGPVVRHHDDMRNECFRKYARVEDSFIDHSEFLKSRPRYSSLFNLPVTDYKGWAKGLKQAGYATNPDYADMLIRKIEENNLQYYDQLYFSEKSESEVRPVASPTDKQSADQGTYLPPASTPARVNKTQADPVINDNFTVQVNTPRVMENNRLQYIIIKEGETLEMIENEFQLFRWELLRFNDLSDDFRPEEGQIIYLQPKRDKAEQGKEKHIAVTGETMHSISQKYGVRLKKLYEYNRISEKEPATAGQVIWLRQLKPAQ